VQFEIKHDKGDLQHEQAIASYYPVNLTSTLLG
jgi:hypothetical protein